MTILRTRMCAAAAGAAACVALLSGCGTSSGSPTVDPYAKVSGAAVGAAADPATLSAPGLPSAADLGEGWSGPGAGAGDSELSSGGCGISAVDSSKLAAGDYTGPNGVTAQVYAMHAANASVVNWMSGVKTALAACTGTASSPAQVLPALEGHPDAAGVRLGANTTWWAVADPSGGFAAVAAVTVPSGSAGPNTDVWAAGVALAALRAAAGQPGGAVGAPPAGGGDLPGADYGAGNINNFPSGIPQVAGGGSYTLPDGTVLTMPKVAPTPTPTPSATSGGDTSSEVGVGSGGSAQGGAGAATSTPAPAASASASSPVSDTSSNESPAAQQTPAPAVTLDAPDTGGYTGPLPAPTEPLA